MTRPRTASGALRRAIALVTILAAAAHAQDAPLRDGAPLAEVVALALQHNPELASARARADAMAFVPAQASAWDDPTLSYEAWNVPESLRIDRADNNIFRLSQKVPFPGKRRLAGEIAAREADRAGSEAAEVRLALVAAVKQAYYDLWQAYEREIVLRREQDLVQQLGRLAEQRYAADQSAQADVLRAQLEQTHLLGEIEDAGLAIADARAALNALLGRAPDEPLGRPEPPPPPRLDVPVASLVQRALETRPDIAAGTAAIDREENALALAERNRLPDFELSVGRFVNYPGNDGFGAMASITLPFANLAKYAAGTGEAAARLTAAQADRRRVEDRLRREVQQAYLRAQAASLRHARLTRTHLPQAEQALEVAEASYRSGAIRFAEVLDTVRTIEDVHLEHVATQGDFARARAALERAVGTELPDDGSDAPRAAAVAPRG